MSNFDRQNTWLSLQPVTGVKYDDGTTQTSANVEGEAVKSTTNSNETSGKVLTADGDGTCSWQAASTGGIKAVRVAYTSSHDGGADDHAGSETNSDGEQSLKTTTGISLSASTSYVLEWTVNLGEDDGGSAGTMTADAEFSTTSGGTFTSMYQVKQYEHKRG